MPKDRKNIIGSSDAPVICGVSPFKTPYELYLEKIGAVPPEEANAAMERGKEMEQLVAQKYQSQFGVNLRRPKPRLAVSIKCPWRTAQVDREEPSGRPVELKTAFDMSEEWGEAETDMVPDGYAVQGQHQMLVTGAQLLYLFVLFIRPWQTRRYAIPWNDALAKLIIEAEEEFRARVLERRPPEPDYKAEGTYRAMRWAFGVSEKEIVLPDESVFLLQELEAQQKAGKDAEAGVQECKARLLAVMGDAGVGKLREWTVTRKIVKNRGYTKVVEPFEYLNLRVKRGAENGE